MADRAAPDVGLGDLAHLDGAHDAAVHAVALEAVLEGEGVDDGGEHAHVVALGAVHARGGPGEAAEDVAPAHDDGDLHAGLPDGLDLLGEALRDRGVDAEGLLPHQGLAGKLEQDAVILDV